MAFKPLGYIFEIKSPLRPEEVKKVVRARKKGWLYPKDGPRGWIAGPIICLWISAFDRHGPMLLASLSAHGFGTRIKGRAGADLNGMALLLLLTPLMAWVTWQMHRYGQGTTRAYLIIGLVFGLGLPFTLWVNSKDRKHAEPLVRFLRETVTTSGSSLRAQSALVKIASDLTMAISGEEKPDTVTAESIHDALLSLGVGDSIVLGSAPETYVQTLLQDDGFIVEKREGDSLHHYQAVRRAGMRGQQKYLPFEEVLAVLLAYGSNSALPPTIYWERMDLAA